MVPQGRHSFSDRRGVDHCLSGCDAPKELGISQFGRTVRCVCWISPMAYCWAHSCAMQLFRVRLQNQPHGRSGRNLLALNLELGIVHNTSPTEQGKNNMLNRIHTAAMTAALFTLAAGLASGSGVHAPKVYGDSLCVNPSCNNADGCSWISGEWDYWFPHGSCAPASPAGSGGNCTETWRICRQTDFFWGPGCNNFMSSIAVFEYGC
jgi:hypothetical protein